MACAPRKLTSVSKRPWRAEGADLILSLDSMKSTAELHRRKGRQAALEFPPRSLLQAALHVREALFEQWSRKG